MRCLILFLAAAIVTVAAARELGRALDVLDLAASGMFDEPLWPGGVA